MKHVLKSGAAALAAATLVLTAAGTAYAESATVNDATGDVWRTPSGEGEEWQRAGSPKNADIDKTVVTHRDRKLAVKTTYKNLVKEDNYFYDYLILRTGAGEEFVTGTIAGPGGWAGEHFFYTSSGPQSGRPQLQRGLGGEECANMKHDISYRKDVVTMSIPRSCFGGAARIKAKSVAIAGNDDRNWLDNAHNRKHNVKGFTRLLSAG